MSTEQETVERASSWCAANGILMGSSSSSSPFVYEPAPFSLHPTPYPSSAFRKAYNLSIPFNQMIHNVAASYTSWLRTAIDIAAKGDAEFTGKMVELAEEVQDTIEKGTQAQRVVLGVLRSDYMLHSPEVAQNDTYKSLEDAERLTSTAFKDAIPLQVELNTIASSFGCLSSKITTMHQALEDLPYPQRVTKELGGDTSIPENTAGENIAEGIAAAFHEYNAQKKNQGVENNFESVVVMVIEQGDTNSCDQRELEFLLQTKHKVRLIRRTLHQITTLGEYNSSNVNLFQGKELLIPDGDEKVAVAVAYFRAGYTPDHYPTEVQWEGRRKLEHSAAIKCPDIFYHLTGAKKIQQELAAPGVLRKFSSSDEEEQFLSSTFAGLYALGEEDDEKTVQLALSNPHAYVLKPQREGGGNNLYDSELVDALNSMTKEERGGYILMQKILPPAVRGSLVRGGKIIYTGETVCEVGVFGVTLREYADKDDPNQTGRVLFEKSGGHILRSKSIETNEGGVAAGYACLSSPRLV